MSINVFGNKDFAENAGKLRSDLKSIIDGFEIINHSLYSELPETVQASVTATVQASVTASIAERKAKEDKFRQEEGKTVDTKLTTYDYDASEKTLYLLRLQVKYRDRLQGLTEKHLLSIATEALKCKTSKNTELVTRFIQEIKINQNKK